MPSFNIAAVLAAAQSLIGTPYQLGGLRAHPDNPRAGLDCSEFVAWCFQKVNITLPWNAQQQKNNTQAISESQAQPGDLVFFQGTDPADPDPITHVGIYLGGGKMINSQDNGVTIADITSGYWRNHLASFGRVVGGVNPVSTVGSKPNPAPNSGAGTGDLFDFGNLLPAGFWSRSMAVGIGAALLIGGVTYAFLSSGAGQTTVHIAAKTVKAAAVAA